MFRRNGIEPIVLYNSTLDNLKKTIENSFKYYDNNCISYIYINCHGSEYGLSMVLNNGSSTSTVSYNNLKTMLDKIPGTKVLMIESCESGASITESDISSKTRSIKHDQDLENAAELINKAIISTFAAPKSNPHLRRGELRADNYQVLAACSATQFSWGNQEGDDFTRYWSEGAGWDYTNSRNSDLHADKDKKGYVTLQDLCNYTSEQTITRKEKVKEIVKGKEIEKEITVTYYQNDMCYPENSDFPVFGTVPVSFISKAIDEYYREHKDIYKTPIGSIVRLSSGTAYQNYAGGVIVRYPNGRVDGFSRLSYVLNRIRQTRSFNIDGRGNDTMELYILVSLTQDGRSIVDRERWPKTRLHGRTDYNIIYEGTAVTPDHPANSNVFYTSDILRGESKISLNVEVMDYDKPNDDDHITTYSLYFNIENGWGVEGISSQCGSRTVNGSQVVYKDIPENTWNSFVCLDITIKKQ